MTNRQGERVRIYRCRGKRAGGHCQAPATVSGTVVEPFVVERFRAEVGQIQLEGVSANEDLAEAEEAVKHAEAELIAYRDSEAAALLGEAQAPAVLRDVVSSRGSAPSSITSRSSASPSSAMTGAGSSAGPSPSSIPSACCG